MALPPEHGGWGLLFEPILIGLIAAPSAQGGLIAVAAVGVFLSRQPLKILLTDLIAKRRVPRMRHAAWFAAAYLSVGIICGGLALANTGRVLVLPLACAVPLALVQLAYDARNRSRGLLPEVCGAAALAVAAAAIAIADGWNTRFAMALWAVAAARTVPAMVTVRTRVLRMHARSEVDARTEVRAYEREGEVRTDERQGEVQVDERKGSVRETVAPGPSSTAAFVAHATAMAVIYALQRPGFVSRAVLALLSVLAARAGVTLRASAPRVRAQRIGVEELIVGLASAAALGFFARR